MFLILLLLIFSSSPFLVICRSLQPSSSSTHPTFQSFDVSASLELTRQVFSPTQKPQHESSTSRDSKTSGNNRFQFSVTIYPRSSLYPHTDKNYASLTLARLARDSLRVSSLSANQLQTPVTSGLSQGSGEYFAILGVGQPSKESSMIIDTGSDITWLQCEPCTKCYHSDSIFNPNTSSSYRNLPCSSTQCSNLVISGCSQSETCLYGVQYGDGSTTIGNFATDTVSFGSSGSVPNMAIGCGHDNEGFVGSDGLLGLGGGPLSLPSQINATSFSYCLVNL